MKSFKRKPVAVVLMLVLSSSAVAADYSSGSHEPTDTVADNYSGTAIQNLGIKPGGRSNSSVFTDNSRQEIDGDVNTVYATHDSFSRNSLQRIYNGIAEHSTFSGTASQEVGVFGNGSATSRFSLFTEQSTQTVGYDGIKARSEGDFFTDNAQQSIHGVGTAVGDSFTKNAAQVLEDSASTLGGKFSDNATQEILSSNVISIQDQFHGHSIQYVSNGESSGATFYDSAVQNVDGGKSSSATFNGAANLQMTSGESDAPVFNDNSAFIVSGGNINGAVMNGTSKGLLSGDGVATGTTTVNDHSTLAVVARPVFDPTSHQADNVVLNGGTLGVLASAGNNPNPVATVGNLTVNGGTVQFGDTTPDANGHFASLAVDMMNGSGGTLKFNGSLASAKSNQLVARQIEAGHYGVSINDATDSKALTLQTLVEASHLDVIRTTGGPGSNKATYDLVDINGKKIDTIDLGIHLGKIDKDDNGTVKIHPITNQTTRSTDALLGALSSGLFISDGEMQSVRSRRGELQNGAEDTGGVWGRYLNDNTHVHAAGTAAYRLEQNGMELGGDKIINVGDDRLALGVFGSYSKNKLKQDRGNSSNVDSWGAGVYATWFGAQGYYVDSVLKYNRFSTTVRSQTETGLGVNGDFDQNGLGASLETGYRFNLPASVFIEPYVRADWFSADGKTVTLSNGLEAKADRLQSIRGEAGVSAGKSFDLNGGMTLSPYVTVAVEHEFDKSNEVRMNDAYNFNNDFSGTTGRYGLGVTSQLTRNASVYLEANYRKGEHVESPVMGNAGFRVSF
ncbi:autotransporter outer membrane beta-barrel domain-containing protein [Enterobacter asburiae]